MSTLPKPPKGFVNSRIPKSPVECRVFVDGKLDKVIHEQRVWYGDERGDWVNVMRRKVPIQFYVKEGDEPWQKTGFYELHYSTVPAHKMGAA